MQRTSWRPFSALYWTRGWLFIPWGDGGGGGGGGGGGNMEGKTETEWRKREDGQEGEGESRVGDGGSERGRAM